MRTGGTSAARGSDPKLAIMTQTMLKAGELFCLTASTAVQYPMRTIAEHLKLHWRKVSRAIPLMESTRCLS